MKREFAHEAGLHKDPEGGQNERVLAALDYIQVMSVVPNVEPDREFLRTLPHDQL